MTLFESFYYIGYSIKKIYALKNQKRLPCRVISIGNLTVGGTGKTPASIAIAEEAKRRGFKPGVLTRGYRGEKEGPCFISTGEGPLLSAEEAGDEPLLIAERLNGVPVIKGKNRYEAGMFSIRSLPPALRPDIFILDDGFQHWSLFRDKDILLIDGTNPFGNRRLLPSGPLREPLRAISRADIVVITKTENRRQAEVNSLIREIRQYNSRAPVFFAGHSPSKFKTTKGEAFPLEWARERRFFGFSGIGDPESFKGALLSAGVVLQGFKSYRDHYRYHPKDIERIIKDSRESSAHWIVTTEKDIMRLAVFDLPENLVFLCIEFSVDEKFYEEVFNF